MGPYSRDGLASGAEEGDIDPLKRARLELLDGDLPAIEGELRAGRPGAGEGDDALHGELAPLERAQRSSRPTAPVAPTTRDDV